ncbi:tripartite tricarboxylate transporter TctB family protein [Roseobacteraceae bacterium S113]
MGRLTFAHLIEAAVWAAIVVVFYLYSFEFNQPIEIYKFGATAWPRVVIGLLLVAMIGNIYYQYKYGSATQEGRVGMSDSGDDGADFSDPATFMRMMAVLFTPFLFAWLLKPVGIYFAAPFFIAAVMWLFGERRIKAILIVTAVIYVIFLGLFLVILNAPLPQGNTSPFYDFSAWILKMNTQLQGLW